MNRLKEIEAVVNTLRVSVDKRLNAVLTPADAELLLMFMNDAVRNQKKRPNTNRWDEVMNIWSQRLRDIAADATDEFFNEFREPGPPPGRRKK